MNTTSRLKPEAGPQRRPCGSKVHLQKVLGISAASSSGLTSDPHSGQVAYLAGCVVVLLDPTNKKQSHIVNTARKPFSALAFSTDGKLLVTGESGYRPRVQVWTQDGRQLAEVQNHKYGVSCVRFSCDVVISVGFQHDMTVCVWDWRVLDQRNSVVATNKVSSRVLSLCVSPDAGYFVTAGKRHLRFWYLDVSMQQKNSTVPLTGRSALLGDHKDSVFSGVACGCGPMASRTFCITSSAVLCRLNQNRKLEASIQLKVRAASCVAVSEDWVFCGCSRGLVVLVGPQDLQQVASLPLPHKLGTPQESGDQYPDTVALTFDPMARQLTCVYSDHSVYVWKVDEISSIGLIYCARYHSGPVCSLQEYPELQGVAQACLPKSTFFSCSFDKTVRLWHGSAPTGCSEDLLKVLHLPNHSSSEGIKVLSISPDGRFLAAGDRSGHVWIFCLKLLQQLIKIQAHDSEVLCVEFSPPNTGVHLLVSGSRDRLVHVYNVDHNFRLEKTLNEHSAAVTAVKFTGAGGRVTLVTCGLDKSVYFYAVDQTADCVTLVRTGHVVEKVALYDMDSFGTSMAVACQDRTVRVYNVDSGKLSGSMRGSLSSEGSLFKVQLDPSGSFLATSSSDKDVSVFDYKSSQCVAKLYGHSEIVTSLLFSRDGRHLITSSGDSCVFLWRLDSLTGSMKPSEEVTTAAPFVYGASSVLLPIQEDDTCDASPAEASRGLKETPGKRLASDAEESEPKMPRWYRKMMGQGDISPAPVTPAPWGIICVYSTPPSKNGNETPVKAHEPGPGRRRWVMPTKPRFLHVKQLPEESDLGADSDPGPDKVVTPPAGEAPHIGRDDPDVVERRSSVKVQQATGHADIGLDEQPVTSDGLSWSGPVHGLDPNNSVLNLFERFNNDLQNLPEGPQILNRRPGISTMSCPEPASGCAHGQPSNIPAESGRTRKLRFQRRRRT